MAAFISMIWQGSSDLPPCVTTLWHMCICMEEYLLQDERKTNRRIAFSTILLFTFSFINVPLLREASDRTKADLTGIDAPNLAVFQPHH